MERWFRREKSRRASGQDEDIDRRRFEGGDLYRKWKGSSKMPTCNVYGTASSANENESSLGSKLRSSQKTRGVPMKSLIEDELLREEEVRYLSSGVITKLVAHDAPLPTPGSMHKYEPNSCLPKSASSSVREDNLRPVDRSCQLSIRDQEEFKDDSKASKSSTYGKEKRNILMHKPSDQQKRPVMKKELTGQSKPDSMIRSTGVKLQRFRGFCSQCGASDSKGCLSSRFDHEKTSCCTKHSDVNSNSVSHLPNHITILKSSMSVRPEDGQTYCRSEREIERNDSQRNTKQCMHKDSYLLDDEPLSRDFLSFSTNPTTSMLTHIEGNCAPLSHIVVLKPTLERDEIKKTASPGSIDGSRISYRISDSRNNGSCKLVLEDKRCQRMPCDIVPLRQKIQSSSELWQENEDISRNSRIIDLSEIPTSGESELPQTKCSCWNRGQTKKTHTVTRLSGQSDQRSHNVSHCSEESSVSREARRHLSNQGLISRRAPKVGKSIQTSSTLGEILALSNRENQEWKYRESCCKGNRSISSRGDSKKTYASTASGSPSIPAPSFCSKTEKPIKPRNDDVSCPSSGEATVLKDTLKVSARNSPQLDSFSKPSCYPCGKCESRKDISLLDMTPRREIGYSGNEDAIFEQQQNIVSSNKNRAEFLNDFRGSFWDSSPSANDSSVQGVHDVEFASNLDMGRFLRDSGTAQSFERGTDYSNNESITAVEGTSPIRNQASSMSNSPNLNTRILADHKAAERTSPISVLDTPDEDARLSSDCFQKMNADLHELHLQLRLLKSESESTGTGSEESEAPTDEGGSDAGNLLGMQALDFSTEEEERDFSYVLGILTASGLQGLSMDMIFSKCYLPETPVDPYIFEKLEKVFDEPEVWSGAERKHLFNFTNAVLSEFLSPDIDLHPWVRSGKIVGHIPGRKVQVEDVWALFVRRRMESSSKSGGPFAQKDWMDISDNIDSIGRQIEKMVRNELLGELIFDLTCS